MFKTKNIIHERIYQQIRFPSENRRDDTVPKAGKQPGFIPSVRTEEPLGRQAPETRCEMLCNGTTTCIYGLHFRDWSSHRNTTGKDTSTLLSDVPPNLCWFSLPARLTRSYRVKDLLDEVQTALHVTSQNKLAGHREQVGATTGRHTEVTWLCLI